MLHPYDCMGKSLKWYRKLAVHLIQRALLNAHIIYAKKGGNLSFKRFTEEVVASLLFPDPNTTGDIDDVMFPRHAALVRLNAPHYPSNVNFNQERGRYLYKKCVVCTKHKVRTDTRYQCSKCICGYAGSSLVFLSFVHLISLLVWFVGV